MLQNIFEEFCISTLKQKMMPHQHVKNSQWKHALHKSCIWKSFKKNGSNLFFANLDNVEEISEQHHMIVGFSSTKLLLSNQPTAMVCQWLTEC